MGLLWWRFVFGGEEFKIWWEGLSEGWMVSDWDDGYGGMVFLFIFWLIMVEVCCMLFLFKWLCVCLIGFLLRYYEYGEF